MATPTTPPPKPARVRGPRGRFLPRPHPPALPPGVPFDARWGLMPFDEDSR